jgi:hypothetical protein
MLALGDSFVEAFSVPEEASLTRVLERALRTGSCPAEVLNGGVAGYSTDQEYLFYEKEGARYSPSVVGLFFFFNDVLGNINDQGKPILHVEGGQLVPSPGVPPRPPKHPPQPPARGGPSALFRFVRARLRRGAPGVYDALARAGLWDPLPREQVRSDLQVYELGPSPQVDASWDLTEAILGALARSTDAHKARFFVAYVPSRIEVSDGDWEITKRRYGWTDETASRFRVAKRLGRILRGLQVPFLDLTPALRRATGPFTSAYYQEDFHWNALGHRVAAAEVARFLRERGWLAACAPPPGPGS